MADVLRANPQGLGESTTQRAARQLTDALCHLNGHGLVHGHLESGQVLVGEEGCLKLAGHGLSHLVWHGCWADFPLRPHGAYMPPELAHGPGRWEGSAQRLCCKVDVWSLGVLLLETAHGPWRPDVVVAPSGVPGSHALLDDTASVHALVIFETACAIRRFADSAPAAHSSLSAAALLGGSAAAAEAGSLTDGDALPLPYELPPNGSLRLRALEESYRQWLSARSSPLGGQDLRDLWAVCLAAHPAARPAPTDLASHPGLAVAEEEEAGGVEPLGAGGLRWTTGTALQSERMPQKPPAGLEEASGLARTPLQYLRSAGMGMDHIFYWWSLAGGDCFRELAGAGLLRPAPPALQLPLYVRDAGADDERGTAAPFLASAVSSAESDPLVKGLQPAVPLDTSPVRHGAGAAWAGAPQRDLEEDGPPPSGLRGFWGPAGTERPRLHGVDLRRLCGAVALAEKQSARLHELRPSSLYDRQNHFVYQWLRARQFRRLLLLLPKSRLELFQEATEDVPPLLRGKVWAALLGTDSDSDRCCWGPFYEGLLASQSRASEDDRQLAVQSTVANELLSHADGRRRLDRLVYAAMSANPSLTRVDGLGALAAPLAVLHPGNEPAAFVCMQQLLHGFLWHLYAQDAGLHRHQCMYLYSSLLGFADPQLALHLQAIGMQPDVYAVEWFPTWFAQLFPLSQTQLLWDGISKTPPQFPIFVAVCLMHLFRKSLLSMDEVSHASGFVASCVQLVDIPLLLKASLALFQAVPASVTLPLYPRHSAGEALLSRPGSAAIVPVDPAWKVGDAQCEATEGAGVDGDLATTRGQLEQRATGQWRQCEWWRRRAASMLTPPVITVDDLLSFRSSCTVVDARPYEEFLAGHFQASHHVREPEDGDLTSILPADVLAAGSAPAGRPEAAVLAPPAAPADAEDGADAAPPWLFRFDRGAQGAPELRLRFVVVVGGRDDFGSGFAERLLCAGVRHVVCLLGGAASLRADAPRYLVSGPE
ncbi:unnamed protein product [Prorocentrum cordatum]|uniref:TBC1 domain family member 23 n=1 Tax=Prorocentrum cordatum TaxID=2364126 RepID=A0ABN9V6X4_9DINO|nr:unnamed protein product [Polarella glacialis]